MNKYIIPNLLNACRVLKLLAHNPTGLTTNEISKKLTVPRTTMLRILTTLKEEGLVELDEKKHFLGNSLIHLGARALERIDVRTLAIPVLKQLTLDTGETSHLAIPNRTKSLLLEVNHTLNPVRVASSSGTLADLHCSATGKVFIAFRMKDIEQEFKGVLLTQRTQNTITTIHGLLEDAKKSRLRGYAMDNEEYHKGVRCLAAPIRNAFSEVVAAIGITASTLTFTKAKIPTLAKMVVAAADGISQGLGDRKD